MSTHATRSENDPVEIVLTVPDRETVVSVLELLSDAGLSVHTEDISRPTPAEETPVTVDLGALTDKQLEALRLALDEGYYERPRVADLSVLAARLGITKSAVSQRLVGAERKLVESALARETTED